jgi:hypothetical protein
MDSKHFISSSFHDLLNMCLSSLACTCLEFGILQSPSKFYQLTSALSGILEIRWMAHSGLNHQTPGESQEEDAPGGPDCFNLST